MFQGLFALVDVNNMYVSCERIFQPCLQERPVVVLSNNDGCAVARSAEVKALGIKMGTPWFSLRELAQKHGIVGLSSNYTLYGDLSDRIMAILRRYSPQTEPYSIDESFLRLNGLGGLWDSPTALGQDIRRTIDQWLGLPVCVGIGASKTLAKLANHVAKQRALFDGVCDFSTMSDVRRDWLLARIAVGEVWGVGPRIAARLQAMGIDTALQLRDVAPKALRAHFGVVVERIGLELRGQSCLALEEVPPPRQQIIVSKSFGASVTREAELAEALTTYVTRAAEKLRRQRSVCGALHVFVATNPFRNERQYSNGVTLSLPAPTADTRRLAEMALGALAWIYREGYQYKKTGVILMDIQSEHVHQGELFDDGAARVAASRVMATLDGINARFGRDTLQLAAAGLAPRWVMRASHRTPRYTTCWDELPVCHAR